MNISLTNSRRSLMGAMLFAAAALASPDTVSAQQTPSVGGRQFPINQMTPPGAWIEFARAAGKLDATVFQPVRVSLPSTGVVTYFEGGSLQSLSLPAPAQAGILVGSIYRLRLSDLPEYPGAEFYPTIELVDRLHPPRNRADDFPVPVDFLDEELEWAAQGKLVTKVIYLEQPQLVPVSHLEPSSFRLIDVEPQKNAIAEADVLGRPVAIVRLGGRTPDPHRPEPAFYGPGGPVRHSVPTARPDAPAGDPASAPEARPVEAATPDPAAIRLRSQSSIRAGIVRLD